MRRTLSMDALASRFHAWLWPDHFIGIRESRRLREEQNALFNSHCELLECLKLALPVLEAVHEVPPTRANAAREAIANATANATRCV